jgi:CDGSH-type Zn-finger protein
MNDGAKIKVTKDGPYIVRGNIPLTEETIKRDIDNRAEKWVERKKTYPEEPYALCRCGKSSNKPFCTGDHVDFDGTEAVRKGTYDDHAKVYKGAEGVELMQDISLCVGAGFCHGKDSITMAFKKKETLDVALQITDDCPGGSLVIRVDGVKHEKPYEKSISATTTPKRIGPLWVKGGIPVESADGKEYELMNRVALCRCGLSDRKPFCDGTHNR